MSCLFPWVVKKSNEAVNKWERQGLLKSKSNPNYKFYPKNPPLPLPTFKPSFSTTLPIILPFCCYNKIKKAPIIHDYHPPSSMGHYSSSIINIIQSSRKPVTFQNSSVIISVGTMTDLHYWMIASKNNKHPKWGWGGGKGKRGRGGGGGGGKGWTLR